MRTKTFTRASFVLLALVVQHKTVSRASPQGCLGGGVPAGSFERGAILETGNHQKKTARRGAAGQNPLHHGTVSKAGLRHPHAVLFRYRLSTCAECVACFAVHSLQRGPWCGKRTLKLLWWYYETPCASFSCGADSDVPCAVRIKLLCGLCRCPPLSTGASILSL